MFLKSRHAGILGNATSGLHGNASLSETLRPTSRTCVLLCGVLMVIALAGCSARRQKVLFPAKDNCSCTYTPIEEARVRDMWDSWAVSNLQDGDVVFRLGYTPAFFGMADLSRLAANISDSEYCHTGITEVENGVVYVYDITRDGARRVPFSDYVCEFKRPFAVKRPAADVAHTIPEALAYCRYVYTTPVPFDPKFSLAEDCLYCTQMTEIAFRRAGLPLSEPIPINRMARYDEYPIITSFVRMFSDVEPDQALYVTGNDRTGMWANPHLEFVAAFRDAHASSCPASHSEAEVQQAALAD